VGLPPERGGQGKARRGGAALPYTTSHPARDAWGTTATARVTGIPASIGAQKLARGEAARAGVMSPDACFDPLSFFEELSRRGINVIEEEKE